MKKNERPFRLHLKEKFRHLPGAPIVEAVIHWVARAGKPFQSEELRGQLTERLPNYPECQTLHELQLGAKIDADGSSTQIRRDTWEGFRLTTSDKLHIVQFTRDGVVFSRLAPYQKWDVFSEEALRVWKIFVELAEPSEVQRLGVRFINRIVPVELAHLGQYLTDPPECLEPLGMPMSSFLYQSLHDVPETPFRINVVQTIQPPTPSKPDSFGLILDVDVFTTQAFPLSEQVLEDYLPKMRWLKNKAFFNLMSKRAIKSFEKEETG